jgi:hypothetical protein
MVGIAGIIFVLIPESPWWLVGKDQFDKAEKVLTFCNGRVEGYDTQQHIVRSNLSVPPDNAGSTGESVLVQC